MKVLHINSYAKAGGAEQVACDLLQNPWVDASLLVKSHDAADPRIHRFPPHFTEPGFRFLDRVVWKLGFRNQFKTLLSLSESFNFTYQKLRQLPVYQEADLVHLHNLHGNYFDLHALPRIARDKPLVWTMHDMWPMTGGEFYTYGNQNYQKGIGQTDIRYLAPLQDPLWDRRQHLLELKKRLYAQLQDRLTFVPVSRWLEQAFLSAYVYAPGLQVQTIYNGFDPAVFFDQQQRTWAKPRVLFFHGAGESKNASLFRQVLDQITAPFDLYVIGQPLEHPARVFYEPYIADRERLRALYNQVDVLVFPSKAETFGLMPLEAMACGVCVIASDATALPEVVSPSAGYLFASENAPDLLQKIELALADLPHTRRLGAQAARQAPTQFPLNQVHRQYYQLYQSILGER